ncbi:MAG: hypothetical protein FJW38_11950 [Acidobacteria bacterium]|nr:hypothetical protein [Acidobacteriota bacterium]
MTLTIVAISRQGDGFSLIGFSNGNFVRLIDPTPDGILRPRSFRLHGWQRPRIWDVLDIDAPYTDGRPAQPENRILSDRSWRLLQRPANDWQLPISAASELFGSRGAAVQPALATDHSILCIEPGAISALCVWRADRENFQARMQFAFGGSIYNLPLADAIWAPRVLANREGEHTLDAIGCRTPHGVKLILSLGETWRGWRYKTVAGILANRRATLWRDATPAILPHAQWRTTDGPLEYADSADSGA